MDDDDDVLGIEVSVRRVDHPTVALRLSWADSKTDEELAAAFTSLGVYVLDVARKTAAI